MPTVSEVLLRRRVQRSPKTVHKRPRVPRHSDLASRSSEHKEPQKRNNRIRTKSTDTTREPSESRSSSCEDIKQDNRKQAERHATTDDISGDELYHCIFSDGSTKILNMEQLTYLQVHGTLPTETSSAEDQRQSIPTEQEHKIVGLTNEFKTTIPTDENVSYQQRQQPMKNTSGMYQYPICIPNANYSTPAPATATYQMPESPIQQSFYKGGGTQGGNNQKYYYYDSTVGKYKQNLAEVPNQNYIQQPPYSQNRPRESPIMQQQQVGYNTIENQQWMNNGYYEGFNHAYNNGVDTNKYIMNNALLSAQQTGHGLNPIPELSKFPAPPQDPGNQQELQNYHMNVETFLKQQQNSINNNRMLIQQTNNKASYSFPVHSVPSMPRRPVKHTEKMVNTNRVDEVKTVEDRPPPVEDQRGVLKKFIYELTGDLVKRAGCRSVLGCLTSDK